MKKKLVLAITLALGLSTANMAFGATLSDVPAKHWAYGSVSKLVYDGIIDGYGDGTFKGDRAITRYEFAVAVAKAVDNYNKADEKDKNEILKLVAEFSKELKDIGARLGAVERKTGNIKFTGDARLRLYQKNFDFADHNRSQERIRLTGDGAISDDWSFSVRFGQQFTTNRLGTTGTDRNGTAVTTNSSNSDVFFDRAEFKYQKGAFIGTLGRSTLFLGQGLLYDFAFDGVTSSYTSGKLTSKVLIGDASLTREAWNQGGGVIAGSNTAKNGAASWNGSESFWASDFKYAANKDFTLTANTYRAISKGYGPSAAASYKDWGVGFNTVWSDFRLLGEFVKNTSDGLAQPNGYWLDLRYKAADVLKPGSWSINARYIKLGKDAIDTTPTTLNYAGASGTKGYEIGFDYAFAKGAHFNIFGGKYKSYDSATSYKPVYSAVTYFSF